MRYRHYCSVYFWQVAFTLFSCFVCEFSVVRCCCCLPLTSCVYTPLPALVCSIQTVVALIIVIWYMSMMLLEYVVQFNEADVFLQDPLLILFPCPEGKPCKQQYAAYIYHDERAGFEGQSLKFVAQQPYSKGRQSHICSTSLVKSA